MTTETQTTVYLPWNGQPAPAALQAQPARVAAQPQPVAARTPAPRSFTSAAVITMVLYCFLWGPGLIANLLFYREARQAERDYGQSLPGVGLLRGLLVLQVLAIAFFMIVAVLVTAAIVGG